MRRRTPQLLIVAVLHGLLLVILQSAAFPQSQATDGQIEGTVLDQNGAAVIGAVITVTNLEMGTVRKSETNQAGVYRFPLLPLGTYRIVAEANGFGKLIRDRITLAAGQFRNVDLELNTGDVVESVTVSGDAPIADTGKTDLGRVMNSREVHDSPLPTRNPFQFVVLQANVTGHPSRGAMFPQVNVNGFLRRTYWQLDGNTNTRGETAGPRTMHISETYVAEMQLLTPGFAAEFGNTTGMIVNMITPSGTNGFHGSGMFLFSRPSFYARPFFFSGAKPADSMLNDAAVTFGGPVINDRWHFYFGYEWFDREDNTSADRQVTIKESHKRELIDAGLPASIFVPLIPGGEVASHYIFRTDLQLNSRSRLTARFNHARIDVENGSPGGGKNTIERSRDPKLVDHSFGLQFVSSSKNALNELRFHFVRARNSTVRNENSGTGMTVNITDVANFGSPDSDSLAIYKDTQFQDNFTWTREAHAIKFGGGPILRDRFNHESTLSIYTFPSIAAWLRARAGRHRNAYGYTQYQESFGDSETSLQSTYWNFFLQDDWKTTRRLKINYGLRYDLYVVPDANESSPLLASRKFNIDKNNFAPRFGFVYALREGTRPLVLRAGAGIYYEPPWTNMYTRALRENGDPKFYNIIFCGEYGVSSCVQTPLRPAFPNTFSGTRPPGVPLPPSDVTTVSPDFETMYAIHSNVQLEQAITNDLSMAIGFLHSGGRHIPVYRNINAHVPLRYLADGRPVFDPTPQARLDPRFRLILLAESAGVSQYDAMTLQLAQRFSRGIQFSVNYTLSRAVDDAPEQEVAYDEGLGRNQRSSSDPTNRSFDKGYSYGDQRHTFVMSLVARPNFELENGSLRLLLNNNQFGMIARASSGERFSPRIAPDASGPDLNNDGLAVPDRPIGIKRNSGKTPPQFNLDLRYSRFMNFTERYRLEVFGDVQNVFNTNNIVQFSDVTLPTDRLTGEMIGPMPDFETRTSDPHRSLESRQLQIGIKLHF